MVKSKQNLPKIIAVVGATASGKTALALALAKKFNGELINIDSRQLYRGLDIATAKEKNHRGQPRTHLLDILAPDQDFSLAEFKILAEEKIDSLLKQGKLPILVGGTGLYLAAVIDNYQIPSAARNPALRQRLNKLSLDSLLKQLKKADPLSYQVIDHCNRRRLIRALEVYKLTGQPFSQHQQTGEPRYQVLQLGLKLSRQELYRRIDLRVERMQRAGLLKETKKLLKAYPTNLPSLSSIGYRESIAHLKGQLTLLEATELIKRNTRRYAKRQLTWFKRDHRIKWLTRPQQAAPLVKKFLAN